MPGMFDPYLYNQMRDRYGRSDYMQGVIAPLEHRDFVRELVRDNPLMALPMAVATPAYTAAKKLGLMPQARSAPSWDEIFAAYEGMFSGLKDRLARPKPQETVYASADSARR